MSNDNPAPNETPQEVERLDHKEKELWRLALLMLAILAVGVGVLSQESLQKGQMNLEALPIGVGVLIILFGLYLWKKKREIDELRGFVKGFQQMKDAPPTAEQLDKLADVIAASRQGYRDLIDSLDHLVFTISLDGEIRTVNQRITELLQCPYSELVGHRLDEIFDEPSRASAAKIRRLVFRKAALDGHGAGARPEDGHGALFRLRVAGDREGRESGRRQRAGPGHYRTARKRIALHRAV